MAKIARYTEWAQKRAEAAAQDLKKAFRDPRIAPAWVAAREAYAQALAHGFGEHYPLVYQTRRRHLLMLISEYVPQLEQEYGPWLGEFVDICHRGELGLEKP